MHEFLNLVLHEMLVVEDKPLRDEERSASGKRRISCHGVVARLEEMIENGARDSKNHYYTGPKPTSKIPKSESKPQAVIVEQSFEDLRAKKKQERR